MTKNVKINFLNLFFSNHKHETDDMTSYFLN